MINNTWNNFKLKMKEKGTGNLLLNFLLLYFTIALSYLQEYPYFFHSWILIDFLCMDSLTILYSGILFYDSLNYFLDMYQDSRSPVPSTPKGNRRFGVLKAFTVKHKANQILPAATEKSSFVSSRK